MVTFVRLIIIVLCICCNEILVFHLEFDSRIQGLANKLLKIGNDTNISCKFKCIMVSKNSWTALCTIQTWIPSFPVSEANDPPSFTSRFIHATPALSDIIFQMVRRLHHWNKCMQMTRKRRRTQEVFQSCYKCSPIILNPTPNHSPLSSICFLEAPVTFRKFLLPCMSLHIYPFKLWSLVDDIRCLNVYFVLSFSGDPHSASRTTVAVGEMLHAEQQCHSGLEDNYSPSPACRGLRAGAGWREWRALPGTGSTFYFHTEIKHSTNRSLGYFVLWMLNELVPS